MYVEISDIRKNPILLQLVDIPKCHLEVDELDDVL
jgi:hypothetical protein